jgi:hypothetical protein
MPVIAVGKKVGKATKKGREANRDRDDNKTGGIDAEAWKKELLKIGPQKRRAKGVSREDHRKWKDEEKAKHRKKVRSMFSKGKKK